MSQPHPTSPTEGLDPAGAPLASIVPDAPAAVLLVDTATGLVVHTDPLAQQLAPGFVLPATLDEWSDAAALHDSAGTVLTGTARPLSLLVTAAGTGGQTVTAGRSSSLGARREPLWVVSVPIAGTPQLDGHSLVVLLRLRDAAEADAAVAVAQAEAQIRDRAVLATGLAFTVVDARRPDQPLIWVNPAFTATTGYTFAESVGRNCRFLQGPSTDPAAVDQIRAALRAGTEASVTLLNYRADGTAFWNSLAISPVLDSSGQLTHFVGIQTDVTSAVEAGAERDRALEAERQASRAAEEARARLALLASASSELAVSLDVDESLHRLAALVVPALGDWVVIHRADEHGALSPAPIVRDRHGRSALVARYAELMPAVLTEDAPMHGLLRGGQSFLLRRFDPTQAQAWSTGDELAAVRDQLGVASSIFVALPGRQHVVGTMVLNRGPESPEFTDDDLQVAIDIGRRAGLTVDNARLYQNEHRVAETLQRSLLPELPRITGLEIAARYRAAENGVQVGGDFYDVLDLPDGSTAVIIGDVVGHDLTAAAAMGHLRGLLRAVAWDAAESKDDAPSVVLRRVDRLVQGLRVVPMATVTYARLSVADEGVRLLEHASAGHPPLLVRDPDGSARLVVSDPGVLLGVEPVERETRSTTVPAGSTLLAFTDGLVERRGEDLDVGLERLRSVVQQAPQLDADDLCRYVMDQLADGEDDTALLAIRL